MTVTVTGAVAGTASWHHAHIDSPPLSGNSPTSCDCRFPHGPEAGTEARPAYTDIPIPLVSESPPWAPSPLEHYPDAKQALFLGSPPEIEHVVPTLEAVINSQVQSAVEADAGFETIFQGITGMGGAGQPGQFCLEVRNEKAPPQGVPSDLGGFPAGLGEGGGARGTGGRDPWPSPPTYLRQLCGCVSSGGSCAGAGC